MDSVPLPPKRPQLALPKKSPSVTLRPMVEKPLVDDSSPGDESTVESLSIDAILQRIHPTQRRVARSAEFDELQERLAAIDLEAARITEAERELKRKRAEIAESERALKESEMLLNARQRLLEQRETIVTLRTSGEQPDRQFAAMESRLNDSRTQLDTAHATIAAMEARLIDLEDQLASLQASASDDSSHDSGPLIDSLDDVHHPSLEDQVAFLREREAFIEQSENTLFEKAQHLQEWETRLLQEEHDLKSAQGDAAAGETQAAPDGDR